MESNLSEGTQSNLCCLSKQIKPVYVPVYGFFYFITMRRESKQENKRRVRAIWLLRATGLDENTQNTNPCDIWRYGSFHPSILSWENEHYFKNWTEVRQAAKY